MSCQTTINFAQDIPNSTDANIYGHIVTVDGNEHLPFATITLKGTTIGTTTDETGHYKLINLPEGTYTLKAAYLGFRPKEVIVSVKKGESIEVNFELEEDAIGLNEVVITGNRNETNRREAITIVNTISAKTFSITQSNTLSEGLNFSPGIRMEDNCQNCGFSQVRMNGMEGPYSQILINSRPIFSGLAGVYGLELIPANMIERVEVIRGGGSALYGSNAIAGTINLILKDPITNSYEIGFSSNSIGFGASDADPAQDYMANFNTSLVSSDNKTGMALYGSYRNREPFDSNKDDFSEIAMLKNVTIGSRVFHRFSSRNKLALDFFSINEKRRGGDRFGYPLHESNTAEAVEHQITTAALTYEQFFRRADKLSIYASGQSVNRDSYYGANQSLSDYGTTKDFSYTIGAQYDINFSHSNLIIGAENIGTHLKDMKLGYTDLNNPIYNPSDSTYSYNHTENTLVSDQSINTTGIFAQYEWTYKKVKLVGGARFDRYWIINHAELNNNKEGNVVSPRISAKYQITHDLSLRATYSQGYRSPQIFDEDLHIETSGSRKVLHRNSPNLKQETSNSFMVSTDYTKEFKKWYFNFLVEGFRTRLNNPFANEYGEPDANGTVIYTRVNAEGGATVQGINLELNIAPCRTMALKSGFTVQSSQYDEVQEFNENRFFRTPSNYGYLTFDWQPDKKFGMSATGNYSGEMLIPYFGLNAATNEGELRKSKSFFDMGIKVHYQMKINGASIQFYAGVKNIFNSYQTDFDSGIDRDPGYVYGPMTPRTPYIGFKLGNFIQ